MGRLEKLCAGIICFILTLLVSASAETIEVRGKNISKPVEVGMTVSFTVRPDYSIRIPAEKPLTENEQEDEKAGWYRITVAKEAENIIMEYPEYAMQDTIVFLRTDLPEGEDYIVLLNGEPAEVAETDPSIY